MKNILARTSLILMACHLGLVSCKKSTPTTSTEPSAEQGEKTKPKSSAEASPSKPATDTEQKPQANPYDTVGKPQIKATGKSATAWENRSAAEEEQRLRTANEWEEKKLTFFEQWASVDPLAAIEASRHTDRGSISVCTAAAVRGWASVNEKAARGWVDAQPENAERTMFVNSLLKVKLEDKDSDLANVGNWLSGQLQLPGSNALVSQFVTSWSERDRDASLKWAQDTLTNDAQRESVLDFLVRDASNKGEEAFANAGKWISELPKGKTRDEMLRSYVREASAFDKEVSKQWVELIEDATIKAKAMEIINPPVNTEAKP